MNEKKREHDNQLRLWEIQNKLQEKPKDFLLQIPSRRLVRELVMSESVSGIHARTLFLFNDIYLLTKPRKNLYRFIEMGDLSKVNLTDSVDVDGKSAFVFALSQKQSHIFVVSSFDEKKSVMRDIFDMISGAIKNEHDHQGKKKFFSDTFSSCRKR